MFLGITQLKWLTVTQDDKDDVNHLVHDGNEGNHLGFALTLPFVIFLYWWVCIVAIA